MYLKQLAALESEIESEFKRLPATKGSKRDSVQLPALPRPNKQRLILSALCFSFCAGQSLDFLSSQLGTVRLKLDELQIEVGSSNKVSAAAAAALLCSYPDFLLHSCTRAIALNIPSGPVTWSWRARRPPNPLFSVSGASTHFYSPFSPVLTLPPVLLIAAGASASSSADVNTLADAKQYVGGIQSATTTSLQNIQAVIAQAKPLGVAIAQRLDAQNQQMAGTGIQLHGCGWPYLSSIVVLCLQESAILWTRSVVR